MNAVVLFCADEDGCPVVQERLRTANIAVTLVRSVEEARRELLTRKYPLLLSWSDPLSNDIFTLLHFVKEHDLRTQVLVAAKSGGVEDAVRLMKAGAADFILSPAPDARMVESAIRAVSLFKPEETPERDPDAPQTETGSVLIGQSSAMAELRSAISLVAKSQTTVLITGESGTGKEIVARNIHQQSNRASKPFIALNCAALPKDVLENELFGHEKGAFTGALLKKIGCFEMADQGTLLFDEVAEMTPDIQAKLLRSIELGRFRRLGGKEEVIVDVRLVAATNKNISAALKSGELREDLYYRLSTIEIIIPPLRERKEDIVSLNEHFLRVFSDRYGREIQQFSDESLEMLIAYDWPGNVRELRNVVERAVVICKEESITPDFLPRRISMPQPAARHITIPLGSSAEEAEKMLILHTLASVQYNKSKAARILGLSRKTLHNKLGYFEQGSGNFTIA